jgi:hypothetical protein
MANCSIPSSIRASGRISTRWSTRLRKSDSQRTASAFTIFRWDSSAESETRSRTDRIGETAIGDGERAGGRPTFNRRFAIWRVKGAWWSSRSSKPLSSRLTGRGRFDSYPLRLIIFDFRFSIFDCRLQSSSCPAGRTTAGRR